MIRILLLTFLLLPLLSPAQVTLVVDSIPANTPAGEDIYVAGNFQGWNPGDSNFVLQKLAADHYEISLDSCAALGVAQLEFKFTRGAWSTVEGNANGGFLPNRIHPCTDGDTLRLQILSWEDTGGANSTANDHVSIMDSAFFMPQLNRSRRIWLYLPGDYATSNKRYPVLYMHDGQNVFDAATSFAGEWEVDETLSDLEDQGDYGIIVVAVDNGQGKRLDEYSPWVNPTYGGGEGDAYMRFLFETLKPRIDSSYRTLSGRDYTGIMGSSMGGLISQYGAIKYQEYFSRAGLFSSSYWFSDSSYALVREEGKRGKMRIYQVVGALEGGNQASETQAMADTFAANGYGSGEIVSYVRADGQHSEWFWAREFEEAYLWLFGNLVLDVADALDAAGIAIHPNPVSGHFQVFTPEPLLGALYGLDGEKIRDLGILQNRSTVTTEDLAPGIYLIRLSNDEVEGWKKLIVGN